MWPSYDKNYYEEHIDKSKTFIDVRQERRQEEEREREIKRRKSEEDQKEKDYRDKEVQEELWRRYQVIKEKKRIEKHKKDLQEGMEEKEKIKEDCRNRIEIERKEAEKKLN